MYYIIIYICFIYISTTGYSISATAIPSTMEDLTSPDASQDGILTSPPTHGCSYDEQLDFKNLDDQISGLLACSNHFLPRRCKRDNCLTGSNSVKDSTRAFDSILSSSLTNNSSHCIVSYCGLNGEPDAIIEVPDDIKKKIDMDFFQDVDHLLLNEFLVDELSEHFGITRNRFVGLYNELRCPNRESSYRRNKRRLNKRHHARMSPLRVAIKTYTTLSEILFLSDKMSASDCLLEKDLYHLKEKLQEHENSSTSLDQLRYDPIYGLEKLRCVISRTFEEGIPRIILEFHRKQCRSDNHIGNPSTPYWSIYELRERACKLTFASLNMTNEIINYLSIIANYLKMVDTNLVRLY